MSKKHITLLIVASSLLLFSLMILTIYFFKEPKWTYDILMGIISGGFGFLGGHSTGYSMGQKDEKDKK